MSGGWVPAPKPLWMELLGSTVVAATLTVVLGTIGGQLIVARYQARVRGDEQALAAYRQMLATEDDVIKRTFDLVGSRLFVSDALLSLASGTFDDENIATEDQTAVRDQRRRLRQRHSEVFEQWSKDKEPLAFLMSYSGQEMTAAWQRLIGATEAYAACADRAYQAFQANKKKKSDAGTCQPGRAAVSAATVELGAVLVRVREERQPRTKR